MPSSVFAVEGCPNEALRAQDGFSLALPDCRAYEQVSPVDKEDQEVSGLGGQFAGLSSEPFVQVLAEGDAITYNQGRASTGEGSGRLGNQFLAVRGSGGWSARDISPSAEFSTVEEQFPAFEAFSSDSSLGVLDSVTPLAQGSSGAGYEDIYLRESVGGGYRALIGQTPPNRGPSKAIQYIAGFAGASTDFGHVVLYANDALTAATAYAPAAQLPPEEFSFNLYEWVGGQLRLVNVLPGNSASDPDAELGWSSVVGEGGGSNAVSAGGSRIFWTDLADHSLYVRVNGETTVRIDASQGPGASGGGRFLTASADGSKVIFSDESRLTAGSTAVAGEPDLYECELVEVHGALECALSDLTVDARVGGHADVLGLLGSSEDGSYLYFVANGVLASGASQGDCTDEEASGADYGTECNLYVWHGEGAGPGSTAFIARLSGTDLSFQTHRTAYYGTQFPKGIAPGEIGHVTRGGDSAPELGWRTAAATPDGRYLAFMSVNPLTGYDNADANGSHGGGETGGRDFEVYLYDAETQALSCASCDPSGERPVGDSWLPVNGEAVSGAFTRQPGWLSEDGRVFFDSLNAIVPKDLNGVQDVYEYEGGHVYLVSSGRSFDPSYFDGASASGNDVFFATSSQLVGQDTDELFDLYDARVDGGIAAQSPTFSAPCAGEACRDAGSVAPALGAPLSQVFSGPGNLAAQPQSSPSSINSKARPLTRAQGLARALKACPKRPKKQRAGCEAQARRQYGTRTRSKAKKSGRSRGGK